MLTRVAANLFDMSRDIERAVNLSLLCEATWALQLDIGARVARPGLLWEPTLSFADSAERFLKDNPEPSPRAIRYHLTFDPVNENSLVSCIRRARRAVQEVRDNVSSEMWEQINRLYLSLGRPDLPDEAEREAMDFFRRMRDGLQFFQGLADSTITHSEPWNFINLGMFLERADNVTTILGLETNAMQGETALHNDDSVHWLSVLRSCEAAEPFARHYSQQIEPRRVVEFTLLNPTFPRSVRFGLASAQMALRDITAPIAEATGATSPLVENIEGLCERIDSTTVDNILDTGITKFLTVLRADVEVLLDEIEDEFFTAASPLGYPTDGVEELLLVAMQQQQ